MEYIGDMLKIISALLAVLGLFYITLKFLREKSSLFKQNTQIKVIEKSYLTADKLIYLVQIIDEVWLVSTTKEQIEFVQKIDSSKIDIAEEKVNFLNKSKDWLNEE